MPAAFVHQEILRLGESGLLDESHVVAGIVRHHERGRGLEPVDQHPALVVHREGGRSPKDVVAPLTAPVGRSGEERVGHRLVVDRLEEAEEPDVVLMDFVVEPIADGGDATDDLVAALGQEVLRFGVLEEGILGAGEQGLDVPTQRRDPEGVPRVEPIGQVDEALEVRSVPRRADAQRWGQTTPRSRPMRANCSSAKSIWSNVCVAMRLVRSRHCVGCTAGGATGIGEDPGVEQLAPHQEGLLQRPDQHRNDRRLGGADVEADAAGSRRAAGGYSTTAGRAARARPGAP